MRRSITARLVAMFALATLATFLLIGTGLYRVLATELTRHQDDELNTNFQSFRYTLQHVGTPERWTRLTTKMTAVTPPDGSVRFWILGDDPRFQYGTGFGAAERISEERDGHGRLTLPSGQTYRTLSERIAPVDERGWVRLVVGVDTANFDRTLRHFLVALGLLSIGAVALVMALGAWIARIGLRPLQRLSLEARALRPKARSQRLNMQALPVELEDLAGAFNGALGRLEEAWHQMESFNADVAHELRTPLANMIGGAQVMLSRPREGPDLREALQSNLEDAERLRSIVNDMLFLARADQGEAATGRVEGAIGLQVELTIEFFEPLLEEAGLRVEVMDASNASALMNVALFRRALSNLLQNAIEHADPRAVLTVTIMPAGEETWIGVSNPGMEIDAEHLPRLFDRFYRVEASRHDHGPLHGHGLGLAIVKAVAAMHGGRVSATSAQGVTTVAFSVGTAR